MKWEFFRNIMRLITCHKNYVYIITINVVINLRKYVCLIISAKHRLIFVLNKIYSETLIGVQMYQE
jgi:hypothetical protein